MTLNGVMATILSYFTKSGSYRANYFTVVEVRHILSTIKYIGKRIQFLVIYDLRRYSQRKRKTT